MRIALIRQRYVPSGGAERVLDRFLAHLVSAGHEVHLVTTAWRGGAGPSVVLHRVPVLPGLSVSRVVSFALTTAVLLRSQEYDLVFSFERILSADLYRAGDGCHREWLRRRNAAEGRAAWRDAVNPLHGSLLFLEKRLFGPRGCRRIIANSHQGKEEIRRHYGTASSRLRVVSPGVDLSRFHPKNRTQSGKPLRARLGLRDDQVVCLFVGSGFERKGLRYFLDAVAGLAGSGDSVAVLVVGKGRAERFRRYAVSRGFRGPLLFTGSVTAVEEYYAAADLFVLPTLYDPFANATLEAMASGLAVVTTAANGASEILKTGESGVVLEEATDVGLLRRVLRDLVRDPARRESWGKEARRIAEAHPEEEGLTQLTAVCEEVAIEKGRG